uniref:Putative secreted protein n=1 Tax=Anopheles darlingi TaxID=43151 RepID=A0A2M4DFE8_ANODA
MSLQLLQPALLLLVILDHLTALLHVHLLEHRVVTLVVVQLLIVQVNDLIAHVVEERLVVGYNQQRLLPPLQIIVKPDDGVQIEMVRRFIEQQQRRFDEECSRQRHTHTPTTGERIRRTVLHFTRKAQTGQNTASTWFRRISTDRLQLIVHLL